MKHTVTIFALAALGLAMLAGCGDNAPSNVPPEPSSMHLDDTVLSSATTTTTSATTTTTTTTTAPPWPANTTPIAAHGVMIRNVPHLNQKKSYPSACESVATVHVLQYYGLNLSLDTWLDEYLPTAPYPHGEDDGYLHGEDPNQYFIGDPRRDDAYGCYSSAIVAGVDKIQPGLAMQLLDMPLEDICRLYIDAGEPVVLWATMYMRPTKPGFSWIFPTGELFTFTTPEHALILIGYDDNDYYFSDSLQDAAQFKYARSAVEAAYNGMGRQAVVINTDVLAQMPASWFRPDAIHGVNPAPAEDAAVSGTASGSVPLLITTTTTTEPYLALPGLNVGTN